MSKHDAAEAINELTQDIHNHNVEAGWWQGAERYSGETLDRYYVPTKLALAHSELSEGLEGFRKDLMDDHLPDRPMLAVELADAMIRIMDLAGYFNYPLGDIIQEKRAYNAVRADHKLEARQGVGGKSV